MIFLKLTLLSILIVVSKPQEEKLLNQDYAYPLASEVKVGEGEYCRVITEKKMKKAKSLLFKYWSKNIQENKWEEYNRQYLVYHPLNKNPIVYINGACLKETKSFYDKTWCLGMATAPCYFSAFVDLKTKQITRFEFNVYKK